MALLYVSRQRGRVREMLRDHSAEFGDALTEFADPCSSLFTVILFTQNMRCKLLSWIEQGPAPKLVTWIRTLPTKHLLYYTIQKGAKQKREQTISGSMTNNRSCVRCELIPFKTTD